MGQEQVLQLPGLQDAPKPDKPGFVRVWWTAVRPFSLPASAVPVTFGATAAVALGGAAFHPFQFALALFGIMLLHGAANILNDVYDFRLGIDQEVLPVSGAVVRRYVTEHEAYTGAAVMVSCGIAIGLYLAWAVSPQILLIGLCGVGLGFFYSVEPLGLKYRALGDLSVFTAFGLLGALGGWVVQTSSFSFLPIVWAVPQALLIIGILHGNNWRDISGDSEHGFSTVASRLGDSGSQRYYRFLLYTPFALMFLYVVVPHLIGNLPALPVTSLAVFLALPLVRKLLRTAEMRSDAGGKTAFVTLDGATAQLNLVFGGLSVAALIFAAWFQR